MKEIIVIGSGGHSKVVIDILHQMGDNKIIGITSNLITKGTLFCGHQILGNDDELYNLDRTRYLIAMGLGGYQDNKLRIDRYNHIKNIGFSFIKVIHPTAIISNSAKLGDATVVFPGVVLNTDVKVGNNSIIATGSTIDHETEIGNNVLISAGVTIGGYAKIEDNTLVALGAKIISGIKIGANSIIAAGAVVISNIDNDKIVYGIPAKERWKK